MSEILIPICPFCRLPVLESGFVCEACLERRRVARASASWSKPAQELQARAEALGLTMRRRRGGSWSLGDAGRWSAHVQALDAVERLVGALERAQRTTGWESTKATLQAAAELVEHGRCDLADHLIRGSGATRVDLVDVVGPERLAILRLWVEGRAKLAEQ